MPTYEYEVVAGEKGCPTCRCGFEARHGIDEPGPEVCPRCGARVRKRITASQVSAGRWNEKRTLGDANLKRHGFKKLVNEGGGKFRVTP